MCGWVARRREHGEHLAFVDVRDHTGVVQCVVDNTVDVRSEYVVRVTGVVRERPEGTANANLPTGDVELGECAVEVLAAATPPPFPIDSRADEVDENVRLQYRYLDLRRERMQRNLRVRAGRTRLSAGRWRLRASSRSRRRCSCRRRRRAPASSSCRRARSRARSTPCRSRPQLFKQLLMVAGIDRYYQIARCLRDEDLRADRQYEFMQLDAEMSFVTQDDVLAAISEAVLAAAEAATASGRRRSSGSRGTTRWIVSASTSRTCASAWSWSSSPTCSPGRSSRRSPRPRRSRASASRRGGGVRPQPARQAHRSGEALGAKGLVWLKATADGAFESPVAKFLSPGEVEPITERLGSRGRSRADRRRRVGDDVRGARPAAQRPRPPAGARGAVPLRVGRRLPDVRRGRRRHGRPKPGHHPFTQPHPDDVRPARDRPDARALAGVRPRAQRLGARIGLDPDPPERPPAADLRGASASTRRRPTASSGSSSTRSSTARRRTAASPSGSTVSSRSSPARRTSARSSPSRRPSRAPTR